MKAEYPKVHPMENGPSLIFHSADEEAYVHYAGASNGVSFEVLTPLRALVEALGDWMRDFDNGPSTDDLLAIYGHFHRDEDDPRGPMEVIPQPVYERLTAWVNAHPEKTKVRHRAGVVGVGEDPQAKEGE